MDNMRRALLNRLSSGDRRTAFVWRDLQNVFGPHLSEQQVVGELWMCLADHLVYLAADSHNAFSNWNWVLTKRGRNLLESQNDYEPDDADSYLANLKSQSPEIDSLVLLFVREALRSYTAECHLAASVMLGVASERAFQLLAVAFAGWLPSEESKRFREVFERPRQTYIAKFLEFRRRIEPLKNKLPIEFSDNMALTLDSVLDLIRVTRNEAGHPTGRAVDRDEAYINLQMFARYLKKLYGLRTFFLGSAAPK